MKTFSIACGTFATILLAVAILMVSSERKAPDPISLEYINNQNQINKTNLELHERQGQRLSDLEDRVRHLEGMDRIRNPLDKPIVPGVPPLGK